MTKPIAIEQEKELSYAPTCRYSCLQASHVDIDNNVVTVKALVDMKEANKPHQRESSSEQSEVTVNANLTV